jgi:hypothetical protein
LGEQSDVQGLGNAAFWLFALFAIAPLAGRCMALRAVRNARAQL